MKRVKEDSSDVSMTCSCQILYDTSLSNISDSECSCSECLQANLQAFNEFKNQNEQPNANTKKRFNYTRGKTTGLKHTQNKAEGDKQIQKNRSIDKFHTSTNKHTRKYMPNIQKQEQEDYFRRGSDMDNQDLDQFMIITKHRTRKYLEQRKKLQKNKENKKQQLKQKIKENLEMLRLTAKMIQDRNTEEVQNDQQIHKFKWNHETYKCQCNGTAFHRDQCCRNIKIKSDLDTNLAQLNPHFQEHRDEILEQRKQKRLESQKVNNKECQYDKCKNHHNRTDKKIIKKIQQRIERDAKKYKQKLKQEKQKKIQEQQVRKAKLRAIDLKSKDIVARSKKYDPTISKTSFQLEIEHFDTFSQLRKQNQERKQARQAKRKIRKELASGKGALEQKLYEFDEQQEDEDYGKPQKNKVIKHMKKQDMEEYGNNEWCQKIVRQAKIQSPKGVHKAKQSKKKDIQIDAHKEQRRKKEVLNEVQKKKKEIMEEYKKRNTNQPSKNQAIRQQYEKKIQKQQKPSQQYTRKNETKDVYRQNYKYQAGKDVKQINTHGDPLLQEYVYHDGQRLKAVGSIDKDRQIFTKNINSLTSKTKLKL